MKKVCFFFFVINLILSCKPSSQEVNGRKIKVVTTTGMLYDAVMNIAGDKVDVDVIMGPGVDPHLYKATQGDLAKINNADIVIYNGLLLEGKLTEIMDKLSKRKPVFAVAETIPDSLLMSATVYKNAYDPHVWFDVGRWKFVVKAIENVLIDVDSENKTFYRNNTLNYFQQLDSLNKFIVSRVQEIPKNQRILVTAHDAFGYFGDAYDIRVEGLIGISTVADFGLKDIANTIDLILENNIKAIFVETSVSDKAINAVVEGCQEKGHEVEIGGSLYSDAMGDFETEEGTYIGMFKKNVNTIVDALK